MLIVFDRVLSGFGVQHDVFWCLKTMKTLFLMGLEVTEREKWRSRMLCNHTVERHLGRGS